MSFVNHEESFRRFHRFLKRAVKLDDRASVYHVLDLGCGTGEASWPLWRHVASVTFLDRSAAMLRLARNKKNLGPRGVYVRGEVERLPFNDSSFDVVVSRGALISQVAEEEVPGVLRHLQRVTKPGGLIVLDFVTNPARWSAPPHLFPNNWTRTRMIGMLNRFFPEAMVQSYDGIDQHGLNRICLHNCK
jgi:ubiquinone/menaquinone biosynthesis C-methylase UbiE